MTAPAGQERQRRRFLQWLSASPLLTLPVGTQLFAQDLARRPDPMTWPATTTIDLISGPKDAVNVFDFEPVAFKNVPPAHFGYMASGIDDEVTLRANRQAFLKYALRPRRLRDVSRIDVSVTLFGTRWKSSPKRTLSYASNMVSTGSTFQTMAAEARTTDEAPSSACQRWRGWLKARCLSYSIVVCAAGPTSSRHWRWGRPECASVAPISGGWARSDSQGWNAFSKFCGKSYLRRCSKWGRRMSRLLCRRWSSKSDCGVIGGQATE
jgi:FMN-dependent dehydrogenase